jgi:succinyl-CoA synthetase alpha subunit
MSILINKSTRLICQGFTGKQGTFHSEQALAYGTKLMGGVTLAMVDRCILIYLYLIQLEMLLKQLEPMHRLFTFPLLLLQIQLSKLLKKVLKLSYVLQKVFQIQDMINVKAAIRANQSKLIGPNCPGVITPGECKIGIMPGTIHLPGSIGIISKSGTLTYEAVQQTTMLGLGQSTCVGIGGDPIKGLNFIECLQMFEEDKIQRALY